MIAYCRVSVWPEADGYAWSTQVGEHTVIDGFTQSGLEAIQAACAAAKKATTHADQEAIDARLAKLIS
jgi:hypothetical protein